MVWRIEVYFLQLQLRFSLGVQSVNMNEEAYTLHYHEDGLNTADLSLTNISFLPRLPVQPSVISILPAFAKDREIVENFITDIYARAYDAHIHVHYPVLMSVRDSEGKLLAATGFRAAGEEPLFLEQYLPQPIDKILEVSRKKIVEIGNLASNGGGASTFLFAALSAYLYHNGFEKAVVTSTGFLERRFRLMGLNPKRHAVADPALLLHDDERWGSYYDTQPHVISGDVTRGYHQLQRKLGAEYHSHRPRLLPRLHYRKADAS